MLAILLLPASMAYTGITWDFSTGQITLNKSIVTGTYLSCYDILNSTNGTTSDFCTGGGGGGGSNFSSWIISNGSTTDTITDGETVRILGGSGVTVSQSGSNLTITSTAACTGTVTSLTEGIGINLTPDTITTTGSIGLSNLLACNAVTEYSVWNGSHWLCDNDGGGTDTNNYTTAISFIGNQLTLSRLGMTDLTASLMNFTIKLDYANITNVPGFGYSNLSSVAVVNITGVNVTNGTTHTLTLYKDDGTTIGVTFDDTSGGGGSGNVTSTANGTAGFLASWTNTTNIDTSLLFVNSSHIIWNGATIITRNSTSNNFHGLSGGVGLELS